MSEQTNRPRFNAVVKGGRSDKPIWTRIGAAFENDNGSLKVMLNANPIDGQFWLFDAQEQTRAPQQVAQSAQPPVPAPAASTANTVPTPLPPQVPAQPQPAQSGEFYPPF